MKSQTILVSVLIVMFFGQTSLAQHNAGNNGKILMLVSNPSVSEQTGWPIGVWMSELTHPYWEFTDAGYSVDIVSPDGGEIKFDSFSDPEDASGYSAFDYISLGFKKDSTKMALVKNTMKLSEVNQDDYKAIFVCGGQGPMYTLYNDPNVHQFFAEFYETGKPTAAICHGTSILLKTMLSNGKYLVEDKKWTGFTSAEEQYADNYVGQQIQPFRIEDEAKKIKNTTFLTSKHIYDSYAVKDGNLITGQQQNSGAEAAQLTIKAIEDDASRYPTYVLVHGAWADESSWEFVRNELAKNAHVRIVNLPAHGADPTSASSVAMNDYVETVKKEIESIDGKVILVGHSMAGMVISQVAEKIPSKISKLVYVSAYLPKSGDDLLSLSKTDTESMIGQEGALIFSEDYTSAKVNEKILTEAVCNDCPNYMKDVLLKYHRAEPTKPLGEKVTLTKANFGSVPKYYIHTSNDKAVGYQLQRRMVKANGNIKKTYEIASSHLPFVVQPAEFLKILKSI